jgi:hypothetical protein
MALLMALLIISPRVMDTDRSTKTGTGNSGMHTVATGMGITATITAPGLFIPTHTTIRLRGFNMDTPSTANTAQR